MSRRSCANCGICCTLVAVAALNKPAGTPCEHLTRDGKCGIFGLPERPAECARWDCLYLKGEPGVPAPRETGIVASRVDVMIEGRAEPHRTRYLVLHTSCIFHTEEIPRIIATFRPDALALVDWDGRKALMTPGLDASDLPDDEIEAVKRALAEVLE